MATETHAPACSPGVPMVMAITCAGTEMYGGHILVPQNGSGSSTLSFTALCWITDRTVQHITVSGYLGLVFLFSTVMLGVMMVKLRKVRGNSVRHQERRRLWRDCVTILGMACVLGVPWGLAFTTYSPLPLPSLYLFTILNGFQDENTAVKDPSTQKMETSFRN
ncbi:hypothetical protein JZ751_020943 [Albula glossodonta]|uniref:G-protein coupled receptors family 2 profile 2 domain-containing protein n=1 Tax=Albula glossodonta TaxID=121402 RepID=A0A8T2PJT7_9TELE|nr:hypothetical protein JZ751_020943 [Albula glossodonta]